jgi:LPS-assembly protein
MVVFRIIFILCFLLCLSPEGAVANVGAAQSDQDAKQPAFIEADEMQYDEKNGIMRAIGHVEIIQGGRVLLADEVIYNQRTNSVDAKGDISLLEADGTIVFAEEAELRDGLKQGVIQHFGSRLSDGSLFSAVRAERLDENITVLDRATYSPCKVCKTDRIKSPLWQLRSNTVTIDQEEQRVHHKHSFFEVYGVPVLYTRSPRSFETCSCSRATRSCPSANGRCSTRLAISS